jgi:hypothetical protein
MRLSDETLRGRTAIAADGQAIGEVAALFIDNDAWRGTNRGAEPSTLSALRNDAGI